MSTDLSMFGQFHHNPDGGVRADTNQLDDVWMIKLLHDVCSDKKCSMRRTGPAPGSASTQNFATNYTITFKVIGCNFIAVC